MDTSFETSIENTIRVRAIKPKKYKAIMYNDDFTTMDFVVKVLVDIFNKDLAEANRIMLDVHEKGRGIAGIYSYDIALTKVIKALECAENEGFPFKMDVEEE